MKNLFSYLTIIIMIFSLVACGTQADMESPSEDTSTFQQNPESTESSEKMQNREGNSVKTDLPEGTAVFDLENGTVMLNSGYEMPIIGLGTYRLSDSECENSVYHALLYGGRLIDTARIYGNEAAVGRGIQRAIDEGICTREEIFVTTKMWIDDYDDGDAAIDASLERLGVDYIDLMILRWHLQAGNIAIPGSSNPDHILENLSILDFSLSDEEMKQLTDLDKNERLGDW